MNKRILSLIVVMAVLFCALPFAELPRAAAKSNASALTALTYKQAPTPH